MSVLWAWIVVASAADVIERWDLEADDGALVPGGEAGSWEWGLVESGPGEGFTGAMAWATDLDGFYGNDSVETLTLPVRDLVAVTEPFLCWHQWRDFELGDAGWVEWTDGADVLRITPVYGYPAGEAWSWVSDGWEQACIDLTGAGDLGEFRLVFSADVKVAATGWYVDDLTLYDGDPVGPLLWSLSELEDTEDDLGPYPVTVRARDNTSLEVVRVGWRVDDVDQTAQVMLPDTEPDSWVAQLPGQPFGSELAYWVDASDGANWTRSPASGSYAFRVALATPTGLQGPEGRVVDTEVELDWDPPVSMHALSSYRIQRDGVEVAASESPSAVVPLAGGGADIFTVSAVYDVGESGPSEAFVVDGHVPSIRSLEPDWAYQGDQLRVTLTGEHLLFVQEDLVVDLGGGLSVLETEVVDVDTARLLVAVDAGAKSEPREVMVTSGDLTASLAGGFEVVVDGAQRPQLTSVDPTFVTQGTEAELIVLASHSFADLPTVDLGEGVVVADVQWFDDTELHVSVVVELDAPLGEHALEVDDGERIFGGLRVQVRDDPPATTRCSTAPGSRGWVWGLVALCGACRSRRMVSPR